MIIWTS